MDYTVHEILQARILEWVAVPFFRGYSQPRDGTPVSCIAGRVFTSWTSREAERNEPKEMYKLLLWPSLVKRNTAHHQDAFVCKADVTRDQCEEWQERLGKDRLWLLVQLGASKWTWAGYLPSLSSNSRKHKMGMAVSTLQDCGEGEEAVQMQLLKPDSCSSSVFLTSVNSNSILPVTQTKTWGFSFPYCFRWLKSLSTLLLKYSHIRLQCTTTFTASLLQAIIWLNYFSCPAALFL